MADRDWILEPTIIMFGCQPWTNLPGFVGPCPVCKGGIKPGHDTRYCEKCGSSSPRIEARVRSARLGMKRREKSEEARRKARHKLRSLARTILSEGLRRQIWNGYKGTVLSEFDGELDNLAKEGRDFLRRIGQEPDFSLILDRHGRVIGRTDEDLCA